ncbi:hypothetical protein J7L02_02260, partial [Candidatus Woesearchaeota archaeon]|nr:hypothetical protein [Candidatus Woesearchaeota archaeon]
ELGLIDRQFWSDLLQRLAKDNNMYEILSKLEKGELNQGVFPTNQDRQAFLKLAQELKDTIDARLKRASGGLDLYTVRIESNIEGLGQSLSNVRTWLNIYSLVQGAGGRSFTASKNNERDVLFKFFEDINCGITPKKEIVFSFGVRQLASHLQKHGTRWTELSADRFDVIRIIIKPKFQGFPPPIQ